MNLKHSQKMLEFSETSRNIEQKSSRNFLMRTRDLKSELKTSI